MKRLIALLLALAPISAFGQATLSVGAAFPMAPAEIRDAYSVGYGLSGSFGVSRGAVFTPRVLAGFSVIQTDPDFLRDVSDELDAKVEGGDLTTIFAGLDALFIMGPGSIRPFIAPGAGIAIISVGEFTVRDIPIENVQSQQAFALTGAAGVAFRLPSGPHLILEARLVYAFTDGDNLVWMPIHAGIAFDLD